MHLKSNAIFKFCLGGTTPRVININIGPKVPEFVDYINDFVRYFYCPMKVIMRPSPEQEERLRIQAAEKEKVSITNRASTLEYCIYMRASNSSSTQKLKRI